MRNFKLTSLLVLFYGIMTGQCITNGTLNATCLGNSGYNSNCVSGWFASHGTPTTSGTLGGNTWAWMWSYGNTGEGIVTNYNFQAGMNYQISFKVKATTNITNPNNTVLNSSLNVRATSGLTNSSSTTIPNPMSQNIWNNTVTNVGANWITINVNFTPTTNFSQLWFYPLMTANSATNGGAQIQMEVDDVVVNSPIPVSNSPAFTYTMSCASNGTISVTATAQNNSSGINHWWGLMETNAAGVVTDAATIGQVGGIQSGNTVTFTGLSASKNYYIKHGVFSSCVTWNEVRTALPQTVSWSNYTTNFNVAPSANLNGTVSVTVQAHNNPVFVNHHWSIFYAPNGSTLGNTYVPNNPDQCCNATATFSNNLVVNEWYYIKHGIWNDCKGWEETRKAFRVVVQGLTSSGNPNYVVEMATLQEDSSISNKSINERLETITLSPNPALASEMINCNVKANDVESVQLVDFMNTAEPLRFNKVNDENIEFSVGSKHKSGIYVVRITKKDQSIITKKLILK